MGIDEQIAKGLSTINEKIDSLSVSRPKSWKTSCVFDLDGQKVNIQVITDLSVLILIRGKLNDINRYFKEAKRLVELTPTYKGYPVQDWLDDIDSVIKFVVTTDTTSKLKLVQTKLQGLMTEDQKREQGLKDLLKSFPDLFS